MSSGGERNFEQRQGMHEMAREMARETGLEMAREPGLDRCGDGVERGGA